jgi:hypothetical protein
MKFWSRAATARASGAGGRTRPDGRPGVLFIVTYGRSGSTLLMGLLNSLPGYLVRGENGNLLSLLFEYHRKAMGLRSEWRKEGELDPSHPWFGIDAYPGEVSLDRIRTLVLDTVLRPEPDTRMTGFKEIRWYGANLDEYLTFLEKLFPGARFLLNTRDHDQVLQSSWWARAKDGRSDLERIERDLKAVLAKRGDRAFHVHYNDYVAEPERLRELCEWLGEEYDADRFARVMQVRHTTRPRERKDAR